MTTTVYCTAADLDAIWDPALLLAAVDDDADDVLNALEQTYLIARSNGQRHG